MEKTPKRILDINDNSRLYRFDTLGPNPRLSLHLGETRFSRQGPPDTTEQEPKSLFPRIAESMEAAAFHQEALHMPKTRYRLKEILIHNISFRSLPPPTTNTQNGILFEDWVTQALSQNKNFVKNAPFSIVDCTYKNIPTDIKLTTSSEFTEAQIHFFHTNPLSIITKVYIDNQINLVWFLEADAGSF